MKSTKSVWGRRSKALLALSLGVTLSLAACGGGNADPFDSAAGSDGKADAAGGADEVTIEFLQWWEPELPSGEFRALIDRFESENPGIKVELLSQPFNSIKDQVVAGTATGILPDVMGIDGNWVSDFVDQGAITQLSELMTDNKFDTSQVVREVQVDGQTYMLPVVNFLFPMFVNNELLADAGIAEIPQDYTSFKAAAEAVTELAPNISGTSVALGLENPTGIGNDFMPWVWSPGGTFLTEDGRPDLLNDSVRTATENLKDLYDAGVVAPGIFTMARQDEVEEFQAGRLGMVMGSLAHINLFRENNPDLDFTVTTVPTPDGYEGDKSVKFASWGVGVSSKTEHPEEAWKLIEFLFEEQNNADLADMANAFPGNINVTPDFSEADPIHVEAFEIWQNNIAVDEFLALPQVSDLQRQFGEQLHYILNGEKTVEEGLQDAQKYWEGIF